MMMSCCRRLLNLAPVFFFILFRDTPHFHNCFRLSDWLGKSRDTWHLFGFYVAAIVASFVQGQIGHIYRSGERSQPTKKCTLTPTPLDDKCIKRCHLGNTSEAGEMKANESGEAA